MKNLIKKSIVVIVMFTTLLNYAKDINPINRVNNNKTTTFLTVKKDNEGTVYKPHLRLKGDRVFITWLSLNKSPFEVEIYYSSDFSTFNGQIFTETIENQVDIQRVYRLDKTQTGTYKIVLNTEGKTFVEYIKF